MPPPSAASAASWSDALNSDMLAMMRTRPPAPPHIPPFRARESYVRSAGEVALVTGVAGVVGVYIASLCFVLSRRARSRGK